MERKAPREMIGQALVELGAKYNLAVVDSDLASSTTSIEFQKAYPDRFFEMGISECSGVSFTTGLATEGFIPFYVNFAILATGIAWNPLRMACYAKANIKIIGTHIGMDDGPDGASHHANEDIALTRVIPNLTVLTPGDAEEIKAAIETAIKIDGPVYIRVGREPAPIRDKSQVAVVTDIGIVEDSGDEFCIFHDGSTMEQALQGYKKLLDEGYKGKLVHVAKVKPLNNEFVRSIAKSVYAMVSIENHSVLGGLGGCLAESIASLPRHAPLIRAGVPDRFTESGKSLEVKANHGVSAEHVYQAVKEAISLNE
ncbi:transketolase [Vibrio ponticus]|uniref:Transketolase n=1 Tax=Vibrio ponticus TaxID=265668 RepID=A0A3N3E1H8_9VIBR|nr:transketolase C-terminal domain-containing protein [Vibrio ponticus]ROV60368.1 transketolase [Vibrio ponticus]